jgi:hypothetical protein
LHRNQDHVKQNSSHMKRHNAFTSTYWEKKYVYSISIQNRTVVASESEDHALITTRG